ncbi:MAG: isochorismate synthase [Dehalococcoidia bacterium]|nr:isochorismate synthase [Dehalococcoidia bacterium]
MLDDTRLDLVPAQLAGTFASIARGLTTPSLVSLPLPREALRCVEGTDRERLLRDATVVWRPAGQETVVVGFGRELLLKGPRNSTLADAAAALREATALPRAGEATALAQPAFFGGSRFVAGGTTHDPAWDGFGGWAFTLPRVLLALNDGGAEGTVTLRLEPGADRAAIEGRLAEPLAESHESAGPPVWPASARSRDWCAKVSAAIGEIAGGRYQKVVLARTSDIERPARIDEGGVLARLASRYSGCYVFKIAQAGSAWLGATPELLCQVRGGTLSTVALAGSVPRGADPESDNALAARLMGDAKERHEHALVVQALREGLAPFCDELDIPAEPEILRVPNIQHLRTPITGQLRGHENLLTIVAALHPSPAVGGWPRPEAMEAIDRLEGMDRGWYAGPIGRLGLDGDGEFAVGLRSGLIRGERARFYAGAGIVPGSDPEREFAETETKFRPLREAVGDR